MNPEHSRPINRARLISAFALVVSCGVLPEGAAHAQQARAAPPECRAANGCRSGECDLDPACQPDAPQGGGASRLIRQITVDGQLFYNDLRDVGHVEWRRDQLGNVGQRASRAPGASNWLSALYVVADVYELDSVGPSLANPTCERERKLGSATTNYLGAYSFTTGISDDDCAVDGDTVPDIGVKFRLRFCNPTRCFSVQNGSQQTYELWHSQASPSSPLAMPGASHTLPDGFFQSTDRFYSMAASHFAGLMEATQIWNIDNEIPFYYEEFGEVFIEFPSSLYPAAKTVGASRMHFPDPGAYVPGGFHEWGHVMHNRAWEGTTGSCGDCPGGVYERDGDADWDGEELEYSHTAFVEGWASFVGVATQYYPEGCGDNWNSNEAVPICSADPNQFPQTASPVSYPNDGKSYARNVAKMFCGWYDVANDDDANMAGAGDHFVATLYSTWSNLENLWDWSGGAAGLDACSYVDYYLNERKSADAIGDSEHEAYVALITDLIYNAGISCDYPAPN